MYIFMLLTNRLISASFDFLRFLSIPPNMISTNISSYMVGGYHGNHLFKKHSDNHQQTHLYYSTHGQIAMNTEREVGVTIIT